jgi:hypothetical protein
VTFVGSERKITGYVMKLASFFLIVLFTGFLIVLFTGAVSTFAGDNGEKEHFIGGQCEYKVYEGHAKIISITKKSGADNYPYERYEVKFVFTPNKGIKEAYAQTEGKEFLLMLTNSSYPGSRFLEKYRIEVGKVFACHLKVIIKGTCTPVLFEFPDIKLDDYLEN